MELSFSWWWVRRKAKLRWQHCPKACYMQRLTTVFNGFWLKNFTCDGKSKADSRDMNMSDVLLSFMWLFQPNILWSYLSIENIAAKYIVFIKITEHMGATWDAEDSWGIFVSKNNQNIKMISLITCKNCACWSILWQDISYWQSGDKLPSQISGME